MTDSNEQVNESAADFDNDDGFSERVLQSFKDTFWDPEVARRGGADVVGPIFKALAIMEPGQPVKVQFNDEFTLVARARAKAPIKRGDPVTLDNVEDLEALEPVGVDPNAGWVVWAVLPNGRQMAHFDFVRNRGHSLRLLKLAGDYITTGETALTQGHIGPALENAMAAAELAVSAQTYMFEDRPNGGGRNSHSARQHWTRVNVGLGNTTQDAHATLLRLHALRPLARYGEAGTVERSEVGTLLAAVRALVTDATRRVGKPLRTQDPDFIARLDLPELHTT